ncbi:MAG: N-acetyl-gamma-glutamyl-phosphate reductase [Candidatus Tectomicrobia bacterium]|uniref:N-acetyl-gamma-glutamyl-phosphate reductase n=1 Tax=Tectimicrobiota bacterium TaxID=2528274 RepID=A0A932FXS2_UNCTE|nr:N-acetyl-gamma-glutamyl-phosphate reductase [Candidatus Tectomicrobia bacterium]
MIQVGILGASGYTGVELMRLLSGHPQAEITVVTAERHVHQAVDHVFPSLHGWSNLSYRPLVLDEVAPEGELFFTALPHGAAMEIVPALLERGKRVIDLSADFRLKDPQAYVQWYGGPHSHPTWLGKAAYGLPELNREAIRASSLVANPGCYPTSVILAAAPLLQAGLLEGDTIIADCKSGISGAGRQGELPYQFCERSGGLKAYQVAMHRHTPEIEQELSAQAGRPIRVLFTPHLAPMIRGILSTVYFKLARRIPAEELRELVAEFYRQEPFVRAVGDGSRPDTRQVETANCCDVGVSVDERTGLAILVSALDNLVKGASGQAIQNMNLLYGLPETMGLDRPPIFP